jgi:hypothetical protein
MPSLGELVREALVLPDYRDWDVSRSIIAARLKLLAVFGALSVAGAFFGTWLFFLAFPIALGLAVAVGFDVFLAGGMESGRQLRKKIIGAERVETRRLEDLAKLEYAGVVVAPTFVLGPRGGLWLETSVLERATGKRIAPSLFAELGAKTVDKRRWVPTANLALVARAVEPVGQQFFAIWLEKTAIPYWTRLEAEARELIDTPAA